MKRSLSLLPLEIEARYTGIHDFLAALHFEGIPIGPQELVWLQHAFSLEPSLDRQGLRDLLACVLIKHESYRNIFEALFEDWCPREDRDIEKPPEEGETPFPPQMPREPQAQVPAPIHTESQPAQSTATEAPTKSWTSWRRPWIMALVVTVVAALAYTIIGNLDEPKPILDREPVGTPVTPISVAPTPPPETSDRLLEPAEQFWTWIPAFNVTTPEPPLIDPVWLALAFALLSLFAGAVLWWRYRRRIDIPKPEKSPGPGPAWLPLFAPEPIGPELLNRDELRAAVWGVERFVSEDETHRIDVGNTVAATAKAGGLPTMRFEPAVYQREVWLWRDDMVQDATVDRLLGELESGLTLAGLPVRLGTFVDTPVLVRWHEDQEFSSLVLEGHRQSALVVILTDGYGMQLAAQSALEIHTLTQVLWAFGEWPRLTFVDCSYGAYGLATLLQAYGLRCIAPEDIPAFLGAAPVKPVSKQRTDVDLLGDLRAWAAATALSPEPVDDDRAFALRQRLGLELSRWQFRHLLTAAEGFGDRIAWSPAQRAELLNWLTQCSQDHGEVAADSPLAQALDYWLERYREGSEQRQERQNPLVPWKQTPAEQRLRMEMALLELWRQPIDATKTLYRLRHDLGHEIRQRLARLAAWDSRQQHQHDAVYLPWKEAEQPAQVRLMLARLGFGTGVEQDSSALRMPVRLSLGLGLCAGLGAIAVGAAMWWLTASVPPVFQPLQPEPFQAVVIQAAQRTGPRTYRIAVGTPKALRETTVQAHSVIDIQWHWQAPKEGNRQKFGQSELWRAGALPQAIRGCEAGWPRRSLVVIEAKPTDNAARQLAVRLLDRGSADMVLLGTDWAQHLHTLIQVDGGMTQDDQLLLLLPPGASVPKLDFRGAYGVVAAKDLQTLATGLDFSGVRPLREIWNDTKTPSGLLLRGGPKEKKDTETDMTFVQVCGGTFSMGSGKDDKDADDDEKPQHSVTLSTFEISTTEITNAQYRRFRQDHKGEDTLPAVDVSWNDAKAFCEHYGHTLPTEAEWEYAARGGSVTRWSFGDDEGQLGNYAWFFDKNSASRAHPVRKKLPNPLGLYDMHGNVWEWVEDCYEAKAYRDRPSPLVDPKVGGGCEFRALRGGSAWGGPRGRRSALRVRRRPERRNGAIGFRCVRRPRRQP